MVRGSSLRKTGEGLARAGFEQHDLYAPAGQLVGQRTATGTGADDDDRT
jgi:hypothetical protein